jgi:MFS family permease
MAIDQGERRVYEARAVPVWRNRDYLLLWGGQAVSAVGSQVSTFALPLLMLALTRSPAQAGFLSAARTLPYLLLGLPAGAIVDRVDRRRLMIGCDAGRVLALGSIPLVMMLGHLPLAQLYVVALVEGTLQVFFNLADTAALTRVVTKAQLRTVTAIDEVTTGSSTLIGPAVGGLIFGLGQALPFLVDAVSYAVSVVSLCFIATPLHAGRATYHAVWRLRDEIGEGLRWLWRRPVMRFLAVLVGGGLLVENGYILAVIVLAQSMGASAGDIGLVLAAGGLGSIAGALLVTPVGRRVRFGHLTLAVHWIWTCLLPLYIFARSPLALAIITALAFGIVPLFLATQFAYRLATIPDELQGRVNGVFRVLLFGAQSLGLAACGMLIQRLGAVPTIALLAAGLGVLSLAATLYAPLRTATLPAAD